MHKRQDEPILFKDCNLSNSGVRIDVIGQLNRSQNMFCRASNWEVINNKYQALF